MKKKRLEELKNQGAKNVKNGQSGDRFKSKAKWKQESENFRAMLRAGRK